MTGKHSSKKSKLPLIIICVAAVAVIIAVCIIIALNLNNSSNGNKTSTTAVQSTAQSASVSAEQSSNAEVQSSTSKASTSAESSDAEQSKTSTTQKVVVPESSGSKVSYFSKTFTPYKALDTESGNSCSLKEVFGSSFTSGNIKFNSDGTFTDNMSVSSVNSGAYALTDKKITATYTNDKNMSVSVIEWNGNTPSEISVNYGGYDVYFN